jgi:hypothetical protein
MFTPWADYHKVPGADISLDARGAAAVHFPLVRLIGPNPLPPLPSPPIPEDLHLCVSRELLRESTPKIRLVVRYNDQTSGLVSRRPA